MSSGKELKANAGTQKHQNGAKQLTIGLFGFGVVGKGLYDVLHATPVLDARIKKICVKNPQKARPISEEHFTTDAQELLQDESINVIVELIDDADAAFKIVEAALRSGKAVVSANKKMVAEHFEELLQLQQQFGAAFLYEAACCASIPIIRNLEEYYDNDLLSSVKGIVNGSTNYILSRIWEEGITFKEALLQAQQLGFAESNPSLDVEGHDAANKLSILLAHAFGSINPTKRLLYKGIDSISAFDSEFARQKNSKIKLVATAQRISENELAAFVLPQFVKPTDNLYEVNNEFNGLVTESSFADIHFFKGKGAGAYPTAAAVLSDIAALRYDYKYEYRKIFQPVKSALSFDYYLDVYVSADEAGKIQEEQFEWITASHKESNHYWVCGVIHAGKLFEHNWWKANGVSLILNENAIAKDVAYKKIGSRSLQLAGIS